MTPNEFTEAITAAIRDLSGDKEALGGAIDLIVDDLLVSLGYAEGAALINSADLWRA